MMPSANEVYRHFKGTLYKIVGVATHSETGEKMVVYMSLDEGSDMYVRPLEMFISPVDKVKYPDVKQKQRFELVGVVASKQEVAKETVPAMENSATMSNSSAVINESYEDEGPCLKPLVEQFLDADSIDERRRILVALQDTVEQDDVTIMATVMDIEIDQSLELPERYRQLMKCLDTKSRFETLRLR